VAPLGFGKADVVVAVPEAWIDVETMADLDDVAADFRRRHGRRLKVATKYYNLTRRFFAGHGIADYRIVESLGATEGTPASGAADLIVDITSTGSTLAANALKRVSDGTILKSEAYLVAALTASWTAAAVDALASIVEPIAGKRALERLLRKTRERR
jgi:ATP phosphoribosyltransferase